MSCGRDGAKPIIVARPLVSEQLQEVAKIMSDAHLDSGREWSDMAVLCRSYKEIDICAKSLRQHNIPFTVLKGREQFDNAVDGVKVMTLHASKGLEFSLVAIVGVPAAGQDEYKEAQLFYVGATRATELLVIAVGVNKLGRLLGAVVT
jgi:superfamily I DNA/RNA helicase